MLLVCMCFISNLEKFSSIPLWPLATQHIKINIIIHHDAPLNTRERNQCEEFPSKKKKPNKKTTQNNQPKKKKSRNINIISKLKKQNGKDCSWTWRNFTLIKAYSVLENGSLPQIYCGKYFLFIGLLKYVTLC